MTVVRKAPGSELFAIGQMAPTKRKKDDFVPRDDVRFATRTEALDALNAETEGSSDDN